MSSGPAPFPGYWHLPAKQRWQRRQLAPASTNQRAVRQNADKQSVLGIQYSHVFFSRIQHHSSHPFPLLNASSWIGKSPLNWPQHLLKCMPHWLLMAGLWIFLPAQVSLPFFVSGNISVSCVVRIVCGKAFFHVVIPLLLWSEWPWPNQRNQDMRHETKIIF